MKFFTIIKGHSERLPNKNFLPLNGSPLWLYSIKNLGVPEIFINTDVPDKLIEESEKIDCDVKIIPRDHEDIQWEYFSAQRGSPVNSMLGKFLEMYVPDAYEPVVLFHVTSPFVKSHSIKLAAEKLSTYSSVSSVQCIKDFAWLQDGKDYKPINFDPSLVSRTQDLPNLYLSRGAFFIMTKAEFNKTQTRNPEPHYFYELSGVESVEIDTADDYELAKMLAFGMGTI